jgi:hypothetical protein
MPQLQITGAVYKEMAGESEIALLCVFFMYMPNSELTFPKLVL